VSRTILTTERLRLREAVLDDAPFFHTLINEPGWQRWINPVAMPDLAAARTYIQERVLAMYAQYGIGLWVMESGEDTTPSGLCGLLRRDFTQDMDLGYALLEAFQGKGFVAEASKGVLDYGFQTLEAARIAAYTNPENIRSIRVLEKLGFSFMHLMPWPGNEESRSSVFELWREDQGRQA